MPSHQRKSKQKRKHSLPAASKQKTKLNNNYTTKGLKANGATSTQARNENENPNTNSMEYINKTKAAYTSLIEKIDTSLKKPSTPCIGANAQSEFVQPKPILTSKKQRSGKSKSNSTDTHFSTSTSTRRRQSLQLPRPASCTSIRRSSRKSLSGMASSISSSTLSTPSSSSTISAPPPRPSSRGSTRTRAMKRNSVSKKTGNTSNTINHNRSKSNIGIQSSSSSSSCSSSGGSEAPVARPALARTRSATGLRGRLSRPSSQNSLRRTSSTFVTSTSLRSSSNSKSKTASSKRLSLPTEMAPPALHSSLSLPITPREFLSDDAMSILSSPSLSPSSSPFSSVPSTPSSVTRGLDSSIEFDANTHFRLTPFGDGNNKNSNTSSKSRPTSTPGTPKHSPLSSLDHTGDDHEKSAKERENIRVNIRVRPVSKSKVLRLQYSDRKIMVPSQLAAAPDNSKGSTSFTFDAVYGETSSQKDVYNGAVRPLVNSVMRGFNASVLAYGQTSSGKTHTMMGEIDLGSDRINVTDSGRSNENRKENVHNDTSAMTTHELHGVIPRAIQDIFRTIAAHKGRKVSPPTSTASLETDSETYTTITFEVLISYLEIYNNKVFDLLSTDSSAKHLPVREKGGVFVVEGLSQHAVSNPADLMKLIRTGHCNRSVSATAKNSQSSRSHSMLTFIIKREVLVEIPKSALPESVSASTTSSASSSDMVVLEKKQTKSKLNLVDLAGSEKYAAKKNGKTKSDLNQQQQSQQNKETLAINGSLTCLAKVIYALTNRNVTHVPYRESKLTRLLRDSLGGNARTLMIACVNPDQTNELETLNTLRYASRAKLIKNKPTVTSSSLTAADQQRYQMLKKAVRELKDKYGRLEQSYDREKAFSTCVTSLVSQLAIVAASSTTNTPRSSAVAVESEPSSFLLSLPSSTSSSSLTGTTTVVEVTDDILAYPTPAQEFESQTTNRESDDFLAPPCDSNLAVTQSKTVSSALSTADGFMQRLKTLPASPNSIPNLVRCSSAFSAIKKHLVKVESLADDASTRTLAFEDADLDKAVSSSPPSSDNSSESSLSSSSPSSSANSSGIAEDNSANIAELQSQLRSETELVQALEVELGQLRREHEALQGETSSMEEARVLLFKEVAEEQNKNAEQEVAHAHAMKARDEREEELCLQTDALNTQIAKKTAECQELNLALQGERMQHLTEHEEMKAVKDAKERVEKEMLEMQTTHQKQEEESLSKTEEDMKVLTRKYEQEQVEREKALVAMKDEYESKGKESQEKMDRLTMEMEAMKRGFEQKAEKIKDEKEQEMKEMVTRMQEEYRSTEEDKLALVTNELETRTALMNALKEEFEGKEKEREKKNGEDAVAIAKERQERALAEKNDAASREKERKDAAAREEKLREEIEKLKKEYTMKTEDKEKELVSLLQVAKDEYAATLEQKRMEGEGELKKYREKSQAEFRSSEEEKEKEMQLRLEALKRDCSAKLQQKETDMKQEMKELTDKIRAEFSSKEEEKANLMKKEIKRVRKEMKKMKKEYKAKEAGVDSDVRGQMDALRQKHAEKERETKKKMLDGLNQARAELAALKKENAQEVAEMAEKMKTVEEKYIAREQDWELEMKERELKAQAESAHREELRDQEVAAKMAKMENEFIEKEREMQALGAEIETILNQSRATEQKLKAEIEKMKILTTMKEQKKAKEIKRKVDAAEHEFRQKEREITMKMATMKEDYMLAAEDKENEALHTLEEMKAVYDLKVQEREQEIMELKKNDTEDAVEKVLELTSKLNAKDKELERMRSAFLSEELEKEQKMKLQMKAMEAEFTEKASKREAEWKKKVERTIQKLYAEHTAKEKEKDKELRMKDKEVEISSKVKDAQCAEKIEAETKKAKSECAVQIKAEIERVKSEFLRKRKEENAKKKAAVKVLRGEKKKLQKELKAESAKTRAAAEAIQQALVRERERIGERQKEMKAMQKKTENRIVEMKAEIEAAAKEHLLRELSEEREKNYDFIIRINEKDRLRQKLMMQMLIRIVRDQICVKMLVGRYAEQRARMQSMQKAFACMMQMVITLHSEQTSKTGDALSLLQVADMSKLPLPSLSRSSTPSSHSLASPLYAPRMYDCDLPECEVELDMRVNDEGKVKLHFILYENDAEDDAKVDAERETLDNYAYAEDDFDAEDEDAVMEAMYFNESRLSDSEMEMEMEAREDNDDKDGPTRLLPASQDNPFSELADICQRLQHKLMETERGLVSRRDLRQSRRGDPTSVSSYLSMSNSMTAQEETALSTVSLPSMMQALPRAPPSSPNTSHIDHVTDGGLNTGHLRRHAIAAALQHSEFGVLSASQLILPAAKLETTLVPADIELSSSGLALSELRNFNNASMSVDSSCGGSNSGSGSIHIEMESRDLRTAPPDDVDVIVEASEKGAEIHEPAAICEKAMDAQELEGKEVEMVVCKTISGVAEATGHYCSESISERNDNAATTVTSIGSGGYHRGGRDSAEKSDTTVFFDFRFDCDKHGYVTLNIHPITDVESSQTADDHMCGGKMYANESKNEHEKAVVAIEAAVNGREIDDEEGVDEEGSTSIEEGGDTFITPNTTMLSTHAIEQDTFLIHGNTGPEAEKKNGKSPHQTPPETSVKNAHRTEEKDEDGQKEEEEKKSSKSSSLLSHMSSLIQVTRERDAGMLSILRLRREKEEQTAKISDLETALIQMQRKCERLLAESAAAVSVAPISTLTSCADAGGLKLSDDTTPVNDILANTLRDNKSETGKENISATSQSSAANSAPANQQLNRKRTAINIQSNGVALSEYSVPSKQSSSSILSQPMTLSQLHSQINSIKAQRRESQQRMGSYMYGAPFSPPPSTMSTNTEGEGAAEDSGVSMNETGSNVCANGALDVSPVMLHYDMDESSRYPFDMMMMMSGDEGDINIHMLTPIPKSSSYHIDKDEIDNDDEVNGNDSSGPGKSDEGVVKERIQDLTRGHTKVDGSLLPLSFLPTSPSPTRNIISAAKEIKVNNTDSGSHVEDVACKENDFSKDFSSAPMLIGNQEKQMQQDKDAKGSKGKHSVPTIGAFSQQRREEMLQNFLAEPLMWSPPVSSPNKTLVTSSDGHTNKSKCGDAPGDKADGEGGNISSSTVNSKAASSSSTTPVPFGTGSRLTYDSMAPVIRDEAKTNNQEKAAPSGADRRTIRFNVDTDDSAGNASMKDVSRDPSKNLSSPYSLPCASSMMSNMSLDMSLCLNKMDLQHELTSYGATSLSPLPLGLGQSLLAEKLGDNNGKMFASISRANDKQADSIGVSSSHHQTGLPPVPVFSTNEEAAGNNVVSTNLHTIAEKKEGDEAPIEVSKARDNASGAISIQENTLANGGPGSGHHRRSSSGSHKFLQSMRFASELLARSKNDTSMSSLSSNSLTTNGSVPASFQGVSSTTNVSNMSNVDPLHSNGGSSSGGRSQAERIRSQLLSSKLQLQKSVRLNNAAQTSTESKSVAVDDGNGASEAQHNALSPNGGGVSKQRLLSRQRMKKRIENRRQDFDETGVNEGQDAGEEDVGDVAGSGSPGDQSGRSQRSFHRRKQKQKSFNHHRQQQQLDHNSSGDKSTIESDLQQEGFSRDSHVHSADAHKQNDSEDNSNADIMALMAAAENDQTMDQTFFKLIDGTVNDDDHGSPALLPTQEQSSRPPAQSRPRHSRSQSQPQTGCSRNHTAGTPGHQAHQKFQLDSLDSSSMFRSFDPVSPQPGGMTRGRANIGYKPCVYDDDVDDNDNHQLISPLSPLPQRSHNRHHRRHSYKAPPKATPSPHYNQSARVDSSMHSSMHSAHSSVHLHTGESLYYSHSNDTNGSIMNHSASSNSNNRSLVGSEPELSHGGPPGARFQDRAELVIPEDETATEDEGDKSFCVVG